MILLRTIKVLEEAMKQEWHPDELAQHWTLSSDERELLGNKAGATRLNFAVLLKSFQFEGRFPERREDVADSIVAHLASQTGVSPDAYSEGDWSERTHRHQSAQIREHCGFRVFRYSTPAQQNAYFDEVLRRARAVPGIEAAGLSDALPLGRNRSWGAGAKGQIYPKGPISERVCARGE